MHLIYGDEYVSIEGICRSSRNAFLQFYFSVSSIYGLESVGTYVYCLWTFYGIVRSSLLYSPLDQSNLVGGTVYCRWPFSGSVRHGPFLRRVTSPILPPLSGPTCIVYGRFPALFGRPFCIALSPNQILSAGPCIVYGRFPAAFVTVRSCVGWRHRSFPRCRDLRVLSLAVFRHCSVASFVLLKRRENPDALLLHHRLKSF